MLWAHHLDPHHQIISLTVKLLHLPRLIYTQYNVARFQELKALAAQHSVPLVVDNTFGCGGALCRPIQVRIVVGRLGWSTCATRLVGFHVPLTLTHTHACA